MHVRQCPVGHLLPWRCRQKGAPRTVSVGLKGGQRTTSPHVLTGVSLQVLNEKFCNRTTTATFRVRRANLIPMQFLGPAPNGRKVYGSIESLFSLLNLITKKKKSVLERATVAGCASFQI